MRTSVEKPTPDACMLQKHVFQKYEIVESICFSFFLRTREEDFFHITSKACIRLPHNTVLIIILIVLLV